MRKLWRQAFIGMLVSTLVMAPEAALAMGWTIAPEQSWVQLGRPARHGIC